MMRFSLPSSACTPRVLTPPQALAPRPRFLSEADCQALLQRITHVTSGGGHTGLTIRSTWTGNVRWARNQVSTSGEVRNDTVWVCRVVNGASNPMVSTNDTSDEGLLLAVREAERLATLDHERPQSDLASRFPPETSLTPQLFSETTYQLDAEKREAAAVQLAKTAAEAGMLSAGYLEVSAHSLAFLDTFGRVRYFPYTQAQYSVTVRDPKGTGSGWAGVDFYDWAKIDAPKLSQIALDKCLASRNAVKLEPGRYTTILEPQAVGELVSQLVLDIQFNRVASGPGFKLGKPLIDARLSLQADPMDPAYGFPPFELGAMESEWPWPVKTFHPATWVDKGVLLALPYERYFGWEYLGQDAGLPNPFAFRLNTDGPTNTVDEMIATTKRGLLVTRFDQITEVADLLYRGQTRDGLWLIENGKISKPIKNLIFTEAILEALNNVEQLGVPQRILHPPIVSSAYVMNPRPIVAPALKIRDFSFTALDDAV